MKLILAAVLCLLSPVVRAVGYCKDIATVVATPNNALWEQIVYQLDAGSKCKVESTEDIKVDYLDSSIQA
jgi:hypothetical protein